MTGTSYDLDKEVNQHMIGILTNMLNDLIDYGKPRMSSSHKERTYRIASSLNSIARKMNNPAHQLTYADIADIAAQLEKVEARLDKIWDEVLPDHCFHIQPVFVKR